MPDTPVTLEAVSAARRRISGHVVRTPVLAAGALDIAGPERLLVKAENLQRTAAFKVRGATNALLSMSPEERSRGVITVSAGNHGIALSYAASVVGSQATVVMPEGATQAKIAAIRRLGGATVLADGTTLMESMGAIRDERELIFVHPFAHPDVIAGQGTVGLEIVEDIPDVDAVVVPVGGGGLISGIATAIKGRKPSTVIIGVEPAGSSVVSHSLAAGKPLALKTFATVADGLNAPWTAEPNFSIIRDLVQDIVTVSDTEILEALGLILDRLKLLVEPAGAAAIAALAGGKVPGVEGKTVVAMLSGGNVDRSRLIEFLS